MNYYKFLSLFLVFTLIPTPIYFPTNTANYSIITCEENPCDFIFNDD